MEILKPVVAAMFVVALGTSLILTHPATPTRKFETKLVLTSADGKLDAYWAVAKRHNARAARQFLIQKELDCLTDNVYREAAFESEDGQRAVATVTLNRTHEGDYPRTICGVVYQRTFDQHKHKVVCQFTWSCKPKHRVNRSLYKQARQIAREAYLKHELVASLEGATLYHAVYVQPDWATKAQFVEQIGQHLFYKE